MPKGIYKRTKPVWNKGTKGVMKPNKTSFKKGQHPSLKTEFKKGHKLPLESETKRRKNISLTLTGRTLSKKHCENMSKGMKNPSKEIKEKRVRNRMKKGWFKNLKKTKNKMRESSTHYWKGEKFSEDHRKNLKIARARQSPTFTSSQEIKIQNFLKQLGIEFFTHQYIKIEHSYQCDILIPSIKTIIECDGDFIHCNPSKYHPDFIRFPRSETKTAKEIWKLDNARTKELIEKGFIVIRLWGSEIKEMGVDDFKDKIIIETFK